MHQSDKKTFVNFLSVTAKNKQLFLEFWIHDPEIPEYKKWFRGWVFKCRLSMTFLIKAATIFYSIFTFQQKSNKLSNRIINSVVIKP